MSVAGWTDRWRDAWPRDVSFVAAALARAGHHDKAADQLRWLRGVQRKDGGFEARYDPSTLGSATKAFGLSVMLAALPEARALINSLNRRLES